MEIELNEQEGALEPLGTNPAITLPGVVVTGAHEAITRDLKARVIDLLDVATRIENYAISPGGEYSYAREAAEFRVSEIVSVKIEIMSRNLGPRF